MPKDQEEEIKKEELIAEAVVVAAEKAPVVLNEKLSDAPIGIKSEAKDARIAGKDDERGKRGGKRPMRGGKRAFYERAKPEFDQKIIDIRRVTRVVAGGRRFSFSVAIVAGDRKGSVGVGTGKAGDTSLAIEKAMKSAKKNMITVRLNKKSSIPHDVSAKFSSAKVFIMPNHGRGLIAGSSVRNVLDLGGVKDVSAKVFSGSKNKLNNSRAAIKALMQVADRRVAR